MARRRRNTASESETTQTTNGGNTRMAGLTPERIAELLSSSRTKGQYVTFINQFIESGEMGVDVGETWPELAGKNANTLKQGFDSAKEKKEAAAGSENVKVAKQEDRVYLINLGHEDIGSLGAVATEAA
jgi:hypothetical protein